MSGIIAKQLAQLQERFSGAHVQHLPSGTILVIVPDVRLPEGWSRSSTTIRFLIPLGYPHAQLDCFWAEPNLQLASGALPQNTAQNPIPEVPFVGLWFSWHLTFAWNPNRNTLLTWMDVILNRMRQIR